MAFKSGFWYPVALVLSIGNLIGIGFAVGEGEPAHAMVHAALAMAFWVWAQRLRRGPGAGGGDIAGLKQQLEQHTTALEDTQAALASQSTQLMELQERVDFAERVLAQARDRLGTGNREDRV